MDKLKIVLKIGIVLSVLGLITKASNTDDYFKYKEQFRICANIQHHLEATTEAIPAGYTFFTSVEDNSSFLIEDVKDDCSIEFCNEGPLQTGCKKMEEGNSFHSITNATLHCSCKTHVPDIFQEKSFNQNFTGVVFSPYVKNWFPSIKPGLNTVSKWNNYTMEDVKTLIMILAKKFRSISTYGTGATAASRSWNQGDSTGLVPVATAEVNKILVTKGFKPVRVVQGIYQNEYTDILNQEVHNALEAAKDANKIFPGTVTGLIFTSDYVTNEITNDEVCKLMDKYKEKTQEIGVQMGIRVKSCTEIIPTKLPEADNNLHSVPSNYTFNEFKDTELESIFTKLLKRVDFIICSHTPPAFIVQKQMTDVIKEYGDSFLKIQKILKSVNPKVEVIAQAGWANWGVSSNGATNNLSNLVEFWNRMDDWATTHQFRLDLFEAFDEPWKNDVNDVSNFGPNGPIGAEGNYGWWKRHDSKNGTFYTYSPKIQELESLTNPDDGNTNSTNRSNSNFASVIVALIIVIFLVTTIIIFLIWRLRKARENIVSRKTREIAKEFRYGTPSYSSQSTLIMGQNENEDIKATTGDLCNEKTYIFALRFPYDKKYELCRKKFTIDENNILGQGHYGIVYKGRIDDVEGDVAFKTLNSNGSIIELKNLLMEIKIMSYVGRHDYIVNLLGAYTAKIEQGEIYLASEYCENGSLENYLKAQRGNYQANTSDKNKVTGVTYTTLAAPVSNYVMAFIDSNTSAMPVIIPQKTLTIVDLLNWSYQIACGMEHIANKKVIHSDLATRNILLTSNGTCKIADFGLSRQLYYRTEYTRNIKEELPWRWMSIESLRSLIFSIESDVWSFGITMWEIFSLGDLPYPGLPGWTSNFLKELETNNYRMGPPTHATNDLYELMLRCWMNNSIQRPSFTELKETLYKKLEENRDGKIPENSEASINGLMETLPLTSLPNPPMLSNNQENILYSSVIPCEN